MSKDSRYKTAQKLILANAVESLANLFEVIDKTPVARDIHTAPSRLSKLLSNPALFTFDDCFKIADLLGVPEDKIINLVRAAIKPRRKHKK